jgi:hypothetical protein
MGCYSTISSKWKKMFSLWPIYYLAPFSSLNTFLLVSIQTIWTFIFIELDLKDEFTDIDTSGVFNILTATLGFILPLQLNSALAKNKDCLDNYKNFTGDIQAFAWDILAFRIKEASYGDKLKQNSTNILSNMFDILCAMPALAKWEFRIGGAKLEVLTTKGNRAFIHTPGGGAVSDIQKQVTAMSSVDACFYKLLDYTKDLTQMGGSIIPETSIDSWERAYAAWGNMGNLRSYKTPVIFKYVLNAALILYSIILPIQFADNGMHAIWMVFIIGYFFLGLNFAGSKVGNAFAEGPQRYQTVTISQKAASQTLEQLWKSKGIIFAPPVPKPLLLKMERGNTLNDLRTKAFAVSTLKGTQPLFKPYQDNP